MVKRMEYLPVIGLEVHAQLQTRTKMFCACKNEPDEQHPNVNVCPICLGHPGTLPSPNAEAIRMVQRVGAALGAELLAFSKFDRKNYFYPDLPKNYQISQYDLPFCLGGVLELPGSGKKVHIRRVHLEEDTARSSHPEGEPYTLIDFNRSGVALMELVTEPDLSSGEEASLFAEELQKILRYLGASHANMEKGEMRVEVNLSLRQGDAMGTKVEVKNLNSFRSVRMAVDYEIARQSKVRAAGEKIAQETRGWHDIKQVTFSQRSKEEAHDYRYFPEPDIPPFRFTTQDLDVVRASIPELPQARHARFTVEYGLGEKEVSVLVEDKALGEYFEHVQSELAAWQEAEPGVDGPAARRLAANYFLSDLLGLLRKQSASIGDCAIAAEDFAELIKLLAQDKVTSRIAKEVLEVMFATGRDPSDILSEREQGEGSAVALEEVVMKVIDENAKAAEDFKAGKEASLQFLIGKVIAATHGAARPQEASAELKKALSR